MNSRSNVMVSSSGWLETTAPSVEATLVRDKDSWTLDSSM